MNKIDPIRAGVVLGPDPTEDQRERARLAVCAAANSPEEASQFLKMLDLL